MKRSAWIMLRFLGSSFILLVLIGSVFVATKKPPLKPININTATADELQQVPGIGPATAEKILTMRKSYGAFKSVDDLLAIKGLGKKRLEKMRKYLTVGKATAAKIPRPDGAAKAAHGNSEAEPQQPPQ